MNPNTCTYIDLRRAHLRSLCLPLAKPAAQADPRMAMKGPASQIMFTGLTALWMPFND
jgi:hypothetical protein